MAETYRAGSSEGMTGVGPGSEPYRSDIRGRSSATRYDTADYDSDLDDYDGRRTRAERRRIRTSLALDDSVVLLGILLGGTAGYMIASAMRPHYYPSRAGDSHESARRDRFSSRRSRRSSGSVEHDETTDLIASSKVEGTTVYNRQGEKLGEVYNFMVGKRSGEVAYAVMNFGGFLGIGQKYHALPWNTLTYDTTKKGYVIDADRERLMGAPSYGTDEDPFSKPDYGRDVQDYWSGSRPIYDERSS